MNDNERRMLAADIATRVRMFAWQPMPAELAAALPPFEYQHWETIPGRMSADYIRLRVQFTPQPQRLELSFDINGNYNVGRILWTPAAER